MSAFHINVEQVSIAGSDFIPGASLPSPELVPMLGWWQRKPVHPQVVHLRSGRLETEVARAWLPVDNPLPPEHFVLEVGSCHDEWVVARASHWLDPVEQAWIDLGVPLPEIELRAGPSLPSEALVLWLGGQEVGRLNLGTSPGDLPECGWSVPERLQLNLYGWIRSSMSLWLGRDLVLRWAEALGTRLEPSRAGSVRRELLAWASQGRRIPGPAHWTCLSEWGAAACQPLPPTTREHRQQQLATGRLSFTSCRELLCLWRFPAEMPGNLSLLARAQARRYPGATLRKLLQRTLWEDPRGWWARMSRCRPATARRLAQAWLEQTLPQLGAMENLRQILAGLGQEGQAFGQLLAPWLGELDLEQASDQRNLLLQRILLPT